MPTNEEIRNRIEQLADVPLACEQPWYEPTDWEWAYYKQLEGAKVLSVGFNQDGFPILVFKVGTKIHVTEISQDPEGNGAGFLFGLDNPSDTGGE